MSTLDVKPSTVRERAKGMEGDAGDVEIEVDGDVNAALGNDHDEESFGLANGLNVEA